MRCLLSIFESLRRCLLGLSCVFLDRRGLLSGLSISKNGVGVFRGMVMRLLWIVQTFSHLFSTVAFRWGSTRRICPFSQSNFLLRCRLKRSLFLFALRLGILPICTAKRFNISRLGRVVGMVTTLIFLLYYLYIIAKRWFAEQSRPPIRRASNCRSQLK